MKRLFCILMVTIAALAACQKKEAPVEVDSLVGTYGTDLKGDGKLVPVVKIDKDSTGYVLYEYSRGDWHRPKDSFSGSDSPEPVRLLTKADLEKEVRHTVDVDVQGVRTKAFEFVHVPAGWTDAGKSKPFTTKTGYFALTMVGPIDLQKM
jgi:hypothetical protein